MSGGEKMVRMCENLTLKACRIIANVEAKELAEAVGVTVDTIYKWEKGRSYPNGLQLAKIVSFYATKGYAVSSDEINFFVR